MYNAFTVNDATFYTILGIFSICNIICMWRIFSKLYNVAGWKSIVPLYNTYIMSMHTFNNWYMMFIPLFASIGVLLSAFVFKSLALYFIFGTIATVSSIITTYLFSKTLHKSTGVALCCVLLPVIGLFIIAFSENSQYTGPISSEDVA